MPNNEKKNKKNKTLLTIHTAACAMPRGKNQTGLCVLPTELYILRSELSWRKLSPTLATIHYSKDSCPDNAIGLVAHRERKCAENYNK